MPTNATAAQQIPAAVQFTQLGTGTTPTGAEIFCVVQNGNSVQLPASAFTSVFATSSMGLSSTAGLSVLGVAGNVTAIPTAIVATTANTILGLNAAGTQLAFTTIPIGLATVAGLSVLGTPTNSNAVPGAITGTAGQTLFVNIGATGLVFGALPLNSASAVTGTLSTANLPIATNTTFGIVEVDGSSITAAGGVISAVVGSGNVVATSPLGTAALIVSLGTTRLTTIPQGTSGQVLLGSTSANPTFQTLSGDITTVTNLGVVTVTSNIAKLNVVNQQLSGGANVTSYSIGSIGTSTLTVNCGSAPLQYATNNAAWTAAAPTKDGSCILLVTNATTAGPITFNGFSVGSNTGDTYTTTNTQKFSMFVWRVNGISGYRWAAHQ